MKYCPNCKRDFEDTASTCRWCELDLVSELKNEAEAVSETVEETSMSSFPEDVETETVFTTHSFFMARDIENAMKANDIPVLVRPARVGVLPEEEEQDKAEAETETETEIKVETEVEAETEEVPEKKGFFARLFKKKEKKEKENKDEYRFTRAAMLLDIIVPLSCAEEAYAVLNKALGLETESERWQYEDEETVNDMLSRGDYEEDEQENEIDELTLVLDEEQAEDI